MLSIKGIYDGENIIPEDPITLEKGKYFKVIITFLEPIEKSEKVNIGKFCGILEDNREAEEIVSEIYKQRENFKVQEVKL